MACSAPSRAPSRLVLPNSAVSAISWACMTAPVTDTRVHVGGAVGMNDLIYCGAGLAGRLHRRQLGARVVASRAAWSLMTLDAPLQRGGNH
jgi:hypothetical protein